MPTIAAEDIQEINISWETIEEEHTIQTPDFVLEVEGVTETVPSDRDDLSLVFEGNTTAELEPKNDDCLGDIELCSSTMGFTYLIYTKFIEYRENMYFISSGAENDQDYGVAFLYRFGKFWFVLSTREKIWFVETQSLQLSVWYSIAISWQETIGLEIYVDGDKLAASDTSVDRNEILPSCGCQHSIFFGQASSEQEITVNAHFLLENVTVFYAHWTLLISAGKIEEGKSPRQRKTDGFGAGLI